MLVGGMVEVIQRVWVHSALFPLSASATSSGACQPSTHAEVLLLYLPSSCSQ